MRPFDNLTEADLENFLINKLLSHDFEKLNEITDKWGFFRQLYMENISFILEASKKDIKKWSNVYLLDWRKHLSPIEQIAWDSIRDTSQVVLYPQFPVFNYFIDFANPILRLGLELDGKDYHSKEKDFEKDIKLKRFGWKIFRVSGSESMIKYFNNSELDEQGITGIEKQDAIEHWILNTCDGLIQSIKYWYFLNEKERVQKYSFYLNPDDMNEMVDIQSLVKMSLKKHKLADFKI
jgi:very-short-patch-repair endonuclease